ncbi:DeoR/GlpR family DNA-binding transcription regulator [Consotaella salsifontis]|uniref:Transcriptional regulator, DeoR family n=1 Tax=Consotaella salsifontis TaxID=1365950 RepID=A0A1T4TEA8_9HYPH|nr:DeoR/GlpR family DNA-binding transcription regulator [Consotaella salsifontis]SKA38825.1 transcriptional regulator, DeoR family [Consotaella salsifontis]
MSAPNRTNGSAAGRLMSEQIPGDSRQARQLSRRQLITQAVMAEGSMRIEDLTDRFNISLMTAHRDLDDLVGRGLLRKTRGVVSAAPTSLIEASDVYRSSRELAEKAAIALAATDFVEPGQAIFLDDSTTVLQMSEHLATKVPLTVITNSLTMMNAIKGMRDLTLIGLGGQFENWCNAFIGHMATKEIRRLRADTLFLSVAAITDGIVFHQAPEMVDIKRAMFDAASKRILLADHTKFERRALHGFAELAEFDTVIVDDVTAPDHLDRMRSAGINVVLAQTKGLTTAITGHQRRDHQD